MKDHQLMALIRLVVEGNQLQSLEVLPTGDVKVMFFDKGGNWHHELWGADSRLRTVEA